MTTIAERVKQFAHANKGKYTRRECAEKVGAKYKTVREIIRENSLGDFFIISSGRGVNGIIGVDARLQENKMRDATKEEQSRIERLLEKNGYRPHWAVSWVHLQDEDIKTTTLLKNPQAERLEEEAQEKFLANIRKAAPRIKKQPVPTKNLAVFASFDVHIGKACERVRTGREYTPEMAVKQVLEGQAALYQMVKPHGVTDILLPMGNDIVHVDNNRSSTTSGTPQDTYGSLESQILLASEFYIQTIKQWAETHNVWLTHIHSNHDRVAGWSVSQIVAAYFHNHPRVHAAKDSMSQQHRKYFVFGNSLIMFHHGEAKEEKLLGAIKAEANNAFWQAERIYCYQGHIHHTTRSKRGMNTETGLEKDHSALTVIRSGNGARNQLHVETVRSPSPADAWHSEKIFLNMPAVEVYLHNERHQFGRFTHEF